MADKIVVAADGVWLWTFFWLCLKRDKQTGRLLVALGLLCLFLGSFLALSDSGMGAEVDREYVFRDNGIKYHTRRYPIGHATVAATSYRFETYRTLAFGMLEKQEDVSVFSDTLKQVNFNDAAMRIGFLPNSRRLWISTGGERVVARTDN